MAKGYPSKIFKDMTDQRFGKLIVLKRVQNDKWQNAKWLCKCDCGNEKVILGASLRKGRTRSCGECCQILFRQGLKKCVECGMILQATPDFFYRNPNCQSGLGSYCKKCQDIKTKEWKKDNPDRTKELARRGVAKYRSTFQIKLNNRMARRMNRALKGNKARRSWKALVDYTYEDLVKRLQKTLPNGFIWQDFIEGKLHIDHKIPVVAFNFSKPEHVDFKKCWALSNLRLLPAKENIAKKDKLEQPFQPSFEF